MKRQLIKITYRLLALSMACLFVSSLSGQDRFIATGSLLHSNGTSMGQRLNDGRVLVLPEYNGPLTCQVYDPATGQFSLTGALHNSQFFPSVCMLNDGRVFVGGGGGVPIEIYDPTSGTFSIAGTLATTRYNCDNAVPLLDGRVLICGGFGGSWFALDTADLYDPVTQTSRSINMHVRRGGCRAVRLADGKVLVMGGGYESLLVPSMEIFDPATETFTNAGNMSVPRQDFGAVVLADGRVFICRGATAIGGNGSPTATCDIYDPATGTITATSQHSTLAQAYPGLALLSDGRVLITAHQPSGSVYQDEIFDPVSGAFTPISGRYADSGSEAPNITLTNGQVLLLGSSDTRCQLFVSTYPPVASAGPDQVVYTGSANQAMVVLDGSGSTDPQGQTLSYSWSGPFGTVTSVSPSVSMSLGVNDVHLTVTNVFGQTSTSTVRIAVVQGVSASGYASLQAQLTAANDQIATLTAQNNALFAANQTLTQKNASLLSLLQSLLQKFEQIQTLSTTINGVSQDGKQAINQALGN